MKASFILFILAVSLSSCTAKQPTAPQSTDFTSQQQTAVAPSTSDQSQVADDPQAVNFTLPGIDGKPLSLSEFRGKYVVLDFWGTWCGWCIKGMPKMKEYYSKYSGKLEIIGIDCEEDEQTWKDGVKQLALPWKHVIAGSDGSLQRMFGVQGYPTKVIIDPQGHVVTTIVGERPEFYTTLDDLLK